jgi:hypothetical protein
MTEGTRRGSKTAKLRFQNPKRQRDFEGSGLQVGDLLRRALASQWSAPSPSRGSEAENVTVFTLPRGKCTFVAHGLRRFNLKMLVVALSPSPIMPVDTKHMQPTAVNRRAQGHNVVATGPT